jgi:hypothetical protein
MKLTPEQFRKIANADCAAYGLHEALSGERYGKIIQAWLEAMKDEIGEIDIDIDGMVEVPLRQPKHVQAGVQVRAPSVRVSR